MRELPVRRHPRLKGYDYSQNGAYFVTICVKDKHEMLGEIVGRGVHIAPQVQLSEYGVIVKREIENIPSHYDNVFIDVFVVMPNHVHCIIVIEENGGFMGGAGYTGRALDGTGRMLDGTGRMVDVITGAASGAPTNATTHVGGALARPVPVTIPHPVPVHIPRPVPATIGNIVRGFKSGVSRQIGFSLWQRSYHDHVIRNETDYQRIWQYIDENPAKWEEDCYYK